jgi:hypothetical protein
MGFLDKLRFWKKRSKKTLTKVDACVSTKDQRTCHAAKVTRKDYKRELAIKNQKLRELEATLAVSKRLKYAEEHVTIWSEVVE